MDLLDYDLTSSLLDIKKKQLGQKDKMSSPLANIPNGIFSANTFGLGGACVPKGMFAIGGDLQTNGADFSTGATHIGAGGSHEENPYDGVQLGADNEGVPNLVEEGEVVFNDYVFSQRIGLDNIAKERFHFPRKKDITYADAAKRLEKEIAERPNDPISKASFKAQMEQLEEQQERQKAEMEAARAREAFEALSPEEQTALMQQRAEQEQMAQEAAQQQAMQEQAIAEQPSPEEAAMMQQQMSPEEQAALEQQQLAQMQANVSALGGELVKAGDVDENVYALAGRMNRKYAKRYSEEWFRNQARALGIDDKYMEDFRYDPNDAEANRAMFNAIYTRQQKDKALETYRTGQRQSKKNELFGDNGLYRMSDDGKKVYKAMTNNAARDGWISADYRGQDSFEDDLEHGRYISDEKYQKLSDEEKGKYRRIHEKAGDKMYDFNGRLLEEVQPEGTTADSILAEYDDDYNKGFKWNDKDAQTLQYPVGMEHSNLSYLRYAPALAGAVGLFNDILTPADYSRAQEVRDAGRALMKPRLVNPSYIGDYMTYKPNDPWFYTAPIMEQSNATQRSINNTTSPSRNAASLANSYNTMVALGKAQREQLDSNFGRKYQVKGFNRGTNQFNADMDFKSQAANQNAWLQAGRSALPAIITGNKMMDDIDARRSASMSANLTNLMQSIGNIGEEAYDEDRLKWLEGTGVLRSDYFNRGKYSGTSAARGGKIKRKRGLTI